MPVPVVQPVKADKAAGGGDLVFHEKLRKELRSDTQKSLGNDSYWKPGFPE